MTHFLILLRNLQPKKVHGKPGQAVPLLPATKKTRARASASQHYIQAELLLAINFRFRTRAGISAERTVPAANTQQGKGKPCGMAGLA